MPSVLLLDNIGKEIVWKLQDYIDQPHKKINHVEPKWVSIKHDINSLIKSNPKEGYVLRGLAYALEKNVPFMNKDFHHANASGINQSILFHNKLIAFKNNGLYKEIAKTLHDIDFSQDTIDIHFLMSTCEFATMLGMGKILQTALHQLSLLNPEGSKSKQLASYSSCNQMLAKIDEHVSSAIIIESLSYLYQNKIDITKYCLDYDDKQNILFVDFTITSSNKNADISDLDITLKKHLVNFTKEKELDDDHFIVSLSPYSFNSYTGVVI